MPWHPSAFSASPLWVLLGGVLLSVFRHVRHDDLVGSPESPGYMMVYMNVFYSKFLQLPMIGLVLRSS